MRSSAWRPLTAEEVARLPWPLRVVRAILHPRDEWLLASLALVLFFIGSSTQTGWLYLVDACIIALLMVGWASPRAAIRHLRVYRDCVPSAVEGETVTVRITVTNPQSRSRHLVTVCDTPVGVRGRAQEVRRFLIPELPARSSVSVEYAMTCTQRGAWEFGEIDMRCAAPVGFFPFRRRLASLSGREIVVCPRTVPLGRVDACDLDSRLSTDHRTFNRVGQSYDFHGIRDYQPGDDTRHLHWPTSARAGRLMVREFREVGAESVTLLVDTSDGPWTAYEVAGRDTILDHAARLAATLLHRARGRSASIVLVAGAEGGADVQVRPRRGAALEWLGRLRTQPAPSWAQVLQQAAATVPRLGRLYVITAHTGDASRALLLAGERGLQATVFLLDACSLLGASIEPRMIACEEAARHIRAQGGSARIVRSGAEPGSIDVGSPQGAA